MDILFFVLPLVVVAAGYVLPDWGTRDKADACPSRPVPCAMG